MFRKLILLTLLFFLPASFALASEEEGGGKNPANASGLPVPRFVTLKSSEINVRAGPGTRYPIQWVYRRAGIPVEVTEEFDQWRKIRDIDGAGGWVNKNMLGGSRTATVKAKEPQLLRADPETKANPVLKLEPLVSGKLLSCKKEWCRLQVAKRKGWMEKKALWGVYAEEIFE